MCCQRNVPKLKRAHSLGAIKSALKSQKDDVIKFSVARREAVDQIEEIFLNIDQNGTGFVDVDELISYFDALKLEKGEWKLPPSLKGDDDSDHAKYKVWSGISSKNPLYKKAQTEKVDLFAKIGVDADGDGKITFREFMWWWCAEFDMWSEPFKVDQAASVAAFGLLVLQ